jgi:hypothetical protein
MSDVITDTAAVLTKPGLPLKHKIIVAATISFTAVGGFLTARKIRQARKAKTDVVANDSTTNA